MQIRKIGPQPEDHFSIVPNALARDRRLSFRARGVMISICSHEDGYHVNATTLAEDGREGRDAIRNAMNELVECGYLRRVRRQTEDGRWRTDINVYPYGDAPAFVGAPPVEREVVDGDFTDDGFPVVGPPTTDFQASVDQSSVSQAVREHQLEDHHLPSSSSSTTEDDGDPSTEVALREQVVIEDDVSRVRDKTALPVVYRRLLAERHNVVTTEQQIAWATAWNSAEGIKGDVPFEPYDHLAIYLTGCSEGRHRASAQTWLRFFIEDRGKHIAALASDEQRRSIAEETPQEREDRYTRRRPPPAAYGSICHGCGCMTATEPHLEGCHVAAKIAGETGAAT